MKRNARANKYEDLVEESELLQATPEYAWIKRKDGTEDTVSFRQIAPKGNLVSKPDAEKPNSEEPISKDRLLSRAPEDLSNKFQTSALYVFSSRNVFLIQQQTRPVKRYFMPQVKV